MNEFLVDHARKNVWCSPYQDHQALLELHRLTPIGGVKDSVDVLWDRISMPEAGTQFHLYQIGSNFPPQLNLPSQTNVWVNLADLCNTHNQIIDLVIKDGRQYPKTRSWLARTRDKNYIVAVQIQPIIDGLDTQPLMMRLYSNAFFDSGRWDGQNRVQVVGGKLGSNGITATALRDKLTALQALSGYVYVFHNGYYREDFTVANVLAGDIVEVVFDPSVYRVVDFPVTGLPTFQSTLDALAKYLLHPNKAGNADSIQYRDDVDVFLYKKDATGRVQGIYYYRYQENAVRMVTHADYALPVSTVQGFVNGHPTWDTLTGLVIRVQMRRSGYDRPLVYEYHHINELYKLSDAQILEAMTGVNSTVQEWTADGLESSNYTFIMRASWPEITLPRVMDAYGYDAAAQLVGNTPQQLTVLSNGERYAVLPHGLQDSCTVYEYDADGLLLGWYFHASGGRYYARNSTAVAIEAIAGRGSKNLNLVLGNDVVTLDPNNGYRLYVSPKVARVVTNQWIEVDSTDSSHVQVVNGKVYWTHDVNHWQGAVKQDDRFLARTYVIPASYNLYRFTLTYTDTDGVVLYIPGGRLDLWVNKKRLVKDIDYVVQFPMVVIINKEYLQRDNTADNVVDVRLYGFAKPDMTLETPLDSGFVQNGMLSYDGRYDIRDDRVLQITLDGRGGVDRSTVTFAENDTGVRVPQTYEGRPYEVSVVPVPIRGVSDYDTYEYRDRGNALGDRLSDYLTRLLPQTTYPDAPAIPTRYAVFSPFMNWLVGDILDGILVIDEDKILTDKQAMDLVADYRWILAYDPCLLGINPNYQTIHAVSSWTAVSVTQPQYAYLQRINTLLLKDQVTLSRFLTIED